MFAGPGASWIMIARLFVLAIMIVVPLSAQAADAVIARAGRYILLLDKEGKPVAGSYGSHRS